MESFFSKRIKTYLKYVKMKKRFQELAGCKWRISMGFCYVLLDDWPLHDRSMISDGIIQKFYPELWSYKPEQNEDGEWWFKRTNHSKRLGILDEILTSTYSKLNWLERNYLRLSK